MLYMIIIHTENGIITIFAIKMIKPVSIFVTQVLLYRDCVDYQPNSSLRDSRQVIPLVKLSIRVCSLTISSKLRGYSDFADTSLRLASAKDCFVAKRFACNCNFCSSTINDTSSLVISTSST